MYRVHYYKTPKGDTPFETFLDGTTDKVKAKFFKLLEILKEHGPNLKRPYADVLRDGVRELRVGLGGDQYRALYFFILGKNIVVTHGMIKKTDKVPVGEIERAIRYKKDFSERLNRKEIQL